MSQSSNRVLIVEDEIFVALEMEEIVRTAGFDVVGIAADKASALDHADQCDIALVDLNLRDGLTGTTIGTMLERDHGVRVIFVTANPGQIGNARTSALGVIPKPFSSSTVRDVLAIAAGQSDVAHSSVAGFMPFNRAINPNQAGA